MIVKPFRWDLTHRNHLGKLIEGERAWCYADFIDDLLTCCSRIMAFADDSNLVFVGRSPESIFDFLSGLLFDSAWFERLELLHFSMRFREENEIKQDYPEAINAMRDYLHELKLDPEAIATKDRPVTFIDLVSTGETFGNLVTLLFNWSNESGYDWKAVRRRIRIIGITRRTKTSPKTWRWQQHADWIKLLPGGAVKNVSVPRDLWSYLGDYQPKVSVSYTPKRWGNIAFAIPSYSEDQLKALRLAYDLFELGRTTEKRQEFMTYLTKEPTMKCHWFRSFITDLKS
jgi:hypothetical protein